MNPNKQLQTAQNIWLQKHAENLWLEYCLVFPKLAKFDCPKVTISNRFTRNLGLSYTNENKISLSAKMFIKNYDTMIRHVLPHELAHQIDDKLHTWKHGKPHHGKQWQEIMIKIGQPPLTSYVML